MGEEAAPPTAFDIASWERDFQDVQHLLLSPPRFQSKSILLLASLGAFVAVSVAKGASSWLDVATLVGVLFVHELGHAAAMRLFGYTDVRIFFIPFLGAATSGRRVGVARWKQAMVLFAGPVPGIAGGTVLALIGPPQTRMLALQLLFINGINLLPLVPLDGGQLFQVLLFSRHRYLELAFTVVAAVAIAWFGIATKQWAFAIIGYAMLIGLPHRRRVLDVARRWQQYGVSDDPAALDGSKRRVLWVDAWHALPPRWQERWRGRPKAQAALMRDILERASQRPPTWRTAGMLVLAWAAALALAAGAVYFAMFASHRQLYTHESPHFSVEMPGEPHELSTAGGRLVNAVVRGRDYSVIWIDPAGMTPESWVSTASENMLEYGTLVRELPAPRGERRFVCRRNDAVMVVRLVPTARANFVVIAGGVEEEPDSIRFIESFSP